ncbi:MAG: hypothetical protein JW810_01460 [Sedimentisphaerales bacterium]|nr:hypothetical protein [Sedimentisphaerales bacterium]
MCTTERREIKQPKLLVVEGKDDVDFFVNLLDTLNIHNYFVWGIGGKYKFNIDLEDLKSARGFSDLTHLGIIRDRDSDDAFKSIKNILSRKMGFSEEHLPKKNATFGRGSPRIGIFITPGSNIDGTMLEDLCLKTVENHPAMHCVNQFADCVAALADPPKNLSKAKTLAFLAAQREEANTIGLGASKGYWDMSASCLDELKHFLQHLR